LLLAFVLGTFFVAPFRVFEGTNVFLAWRGKAPLSTNWIELESVIVQPPTYLREPAELVEFGVSAATAKGGTLTIRGLPRFTGRMLIITDGEREVPFVSDGQGGLLARYSVEKSAELRIAARFGSVLVQQNPSLSLRVIVDEPPEVDLAQAPSRLDIARLTEVPLHYQVRDDHGIVFIELVLRSGAQKERRKLIQLGRETRRYEGTYLLKVDDSFIEHSADSVEVRIAARDGNGVDGPAETLSKELILDKPTVGAVQLERITALRGLRSVLVDWYDAVRRRQTLDQSTNDYVTQVLSAKKRYFSLLGSGGPRATYVRSFVRAQTDKLTYQRVQGRKGEELLTDATLAIDALLEVISKGDAEQVARQLGLIVEDIENGAKDYLSSERRALAEERVKNALERFRLGAETITQLGVLGADLGTIALAGATRMTRLVERQDYRNVERAASFLAERMRRPVPSFVGATHPSVESGTSRVAAFDSEQRGIPSSEADTHFERIAYELRELAEEHAVVCDGVRQLVERFEQSIGVDRELRERASRKMSGELREFASKEREFAERTRAIAIREAKADTVLPVDVRTDLGDAARLMKEAALELDSARGASAIERQSQAQRLLERSGLGEQVSGSSDESGTDARSAKTRRPFGSEGTVAVTSDAEARERFRRRVLDGLGKELPSDEANKVHRYAEGLLR
jgi:hypothetical protein